MNRGVKSLKKPMSSLVRKVPLSDNQHGTDCGLSAQVLTLGVTDWPISGSRLARAHRVLLAARIPCARGCAGAWKLHCNSTTAFRSFSRSMSALAIQSEAEGASSDLGVPPKPPLDHTITIDIRIMWA
jgi:hypothetical protein